ncbi:HipA family kinase [Metabacillus dongyingensis]|uniref:HipA family kinase n=1 Tax=Metabacillus dongyingensis TaxID=2874282 RepID=UPI003B8B11B1
MSDIEIMPIKYLKTLEGNYAQLFLFSDGKQYVVKFHMVRKYRKREIVNEWLTAKLVHLLDLPGLPIKVVHMPEDSLAEIPAFRNSSYMQGNHLAFPFLTNVKSYTELSMPPQKENLVNMKDLAGMLVFDQWVNNNDRSRTNILFEEKENETYFFWMIDHGRCFPGMYEWNEDTLSKEPVYRVNMPVYKWASSLLMDPLLLYDFSEKMRNVKKEDIRAILAEIPSDWNVTKQEKEKLLAFLKREGLHELPKLIMDANSEYFGT